MTPENRNCYRIQLTVAVYKDRKMVYRDEMVVPTLYTRRSEARAHIKREIKSRVENSNFFRSPRMDYDLVQYAEEATRNTYLRYRILEEACKPEQTAQEVRPRVVSRSKNT